MYISPQPQRFFALLVMFIFVAGQAIAQQSTSVPEPIRFYPVGDHMLFSMYSLYEPEVDRARSDGFTAIGPYYGKPDLSKSIARAQAAKLPIVYSIGPRLDFKTNPNATHGEELKILVADVRAASQHPEISVWALANEELRYWRPAEMSWLQAATNAIRKNDPLKRPVLMYEPNHRSADALAKTSTYLDFVTKGAYANHIGMKYNP